MAFESNTPTAAPYNPINGKELLDVILRRAYKQLSDHQDFAESITYPAYSFVLTIDLMVPHMEDTHYVTQAIGGQGIVDKPTLKTHKLDLRGAAAPDQDRADANLPLPRPTLTSGGIVDIPSQ